MNTRIKMIALAALSSLSFVACADDAQTGDEQNVTEVTISAEPRDGGEVEVFRSNANDEFYFRLKAANGEIILQSEGYENLAGAVNGAESMKENASESRGFQLKPSSRNPRGLSAGEWFFNVKAANGAVIGTSEMYSSKSNAKRGAETVMGYSLGETMLDYWTDQCGFELFEGADEDIWFRLRAGNGEKILISEGYSSESAAKTGVDTVVTVSIQAGYGDDTLPAYELLEAENGEFYWNLVAGNGEVVGTSGETFTTRQAAEDSIAVVQEHAETMIECWTIDEPQVL